MHKKMQIKYTFFMEKFNCKNILDGDFVNEVFECGNCGNHVCKTQAEIWGRVCPHCFGRLYRIS